MCARFFARRLKTRVFQVVAPEIVHFVVVQFIIWNLNLIILSDLTLLPFILLLLLLPLLFINSFLLLLSLRGQLSQRLRGRGG
jgi:hypothetical protein